MLRPPPRWHGRPAWPVKSAAAGGCGFALGGQLCDETQADCSVEQRAKPRQRRGWARRSGVALIEREPARRPWFRRFSRAVNLLVTGKHRQLLRRNHSHPSPGRCRIKICPSLSSDRK
jgi:hypothetical protein